MSDEYEKIQKMLNEESNRQKSHPDEMGKKAELKMILTDIIILFPVTLALMFSISAVISRKDLSQFWENTFVGAMVVFGFCLSWIIYSIKIANANFLGEMNRRAWTNSASNTNFVRDYFSTLSFGSVVNAGFIVSFIYLVVFYVVYLNP